MGAKRCVLPLPFGLSHFTGAIDPVDSVCVVVEFISRAIAVFDNDKYHQRTRNAHCQAQHAHHTGNSVAFEPPPCDFEVFHFLSPADRNGQIIFDHDLIPCSVCERVNV